MHVIKQSFQRWTTAQKQEMLVHLHCSAWHKRTQLTHVAARLV